MDRTHIAQSRSNGELVCDLSAIFPTDRLRYHELRVQLRTAHISFKFVHNGYVLRLNEERMSLEEVSEWIGLEGLCCPWLLLKAERVKPRTAEVRMKPAGSAEQPIRMALRELLTKMIIL